MVLKFIGVKRKSLQISKSEGFRSVPKEGIEPAFAGRPSHPKIHDLPAGAQALMAAGRPAGRQVLSRALCLQE